MMQLGLFPSFQYADTQAENPLLNDHVKFPPGVYQTSVQPIGPYYQSSRTMMGGLGRRLSGLGTVGSAISGIGTAIILGLAAYGGWSAYKKFAK